jgi:hypothetical protein
MCKENEYKRIESFRKDRKEYMVSCFGGKCQCCGYDKCIQALEFHHLDPSKKDFTLCTNLIQKWTKIANELKKCILVCANCHREIHEGIRQIDITKTYYDEEKINNYERSAEQRYKKCYDVCPVCGKQKLISKRYCSVECTNKAHFHVDWENYDLIYKIEIEKKSLNSIAKELNVSWHAVKKRYKKLKQAL